jgi:hypothetical protein
MSTSSSRPLIVLQFALELEIDVAEQDVSRHQRAGTFLPK